MSKKYAMYVWTNGFDKNVPGVEISNFIEWDQNGPFFTHVWDTKAKREWLWASCNKKHREIDTIFVSGVLDCLKAGFETGNFDTQEIKTVKDMLNEGHTKVPNLKIYGLFASSDKEVSEKDMVKYIVHYNDHCAKNTVEQFDGVAVNNEAYTEIKSSALSDKLLYLDKLQQIVTEARKQRNRKLLTLYSVGWHWGDIDGKTELINWKDRTSDVIGHMIDIFDSTDVQVGCISYPDISERMKKAGYDYAVSLTKPIFITFYTNPVTPNEATSTTFFPHSACTEDNHTESALFSIIDGFETNGIPKARACIHFFRGIYSTGVHPKWPGHY